MGTELEKLDKSQPELREKITATKAALERLKEDDTNLEDQIFQISNSIVAEVGIFPPSHGPASVISHTIADSNTIINGHTGVWLCGTSQTSISDLDGNPVVPNSTCSAGGS